MLYNLLFGDLSPSDGADDNSGKHKDDEECKADRPLIISFSSLLPLIGDRQLLHRQDRVT
jgi:hypothetical protein